MKAGWKIKKLKEVCDKITDGTHQTPKYFEDGVIFLSSKNVTSGKIDWDNIKYIDNKQHLEMHKRIAPRLNDILLAKNGTTGVAAMVDRDVVFDIYVSLAHIRVLDEIIPDFMLYFINSPIAKKQFNKRLKGIGVPNLHLEEIREVEIPFPKSLQEQQQIVTILDETFEAIDQAIANIEKNIANAKELFQSKLNDIFSQKGDGWDEKKFGEVCEFVRGPFGGSLKKSCFVENGYAVYEQQHAINDQFDSIRYFVNDHKFDEMKRFELNSGDVIMSCSGTMGKVAIVPPNIKRGIINQALLKLTPNKSINREFLKRWMESTHFFNEIAKNSKGAAIKNVASVKILKEIKVPLVPIEKQSEIIDYIDTLESNTIDLLENFNSKKSNLEELKKSILQKAFAGDLTN